METPTETQGLVVTKGGNAPLTTTKDGAPTGLNKLCIGLGWDIKTTAPEGSDLDAMAFCLDDKGKLLGIDKVLYFGLATSSGAPFNILGGAVHHSGDNLTGAGDGDDELITIDLAKVPADIAEIAIVCQCFNVNKPTRINFGQVQNPVIRAFNGETSQEILRFELAEDNATAEAVWFGSVYRKDGEWKFRAKGEEIPNATDVQATAKFFG